MQCLRKNNIILLQVKNLVLRTSCEENGYECRDCVKKALRSHRKVLAVHYQLSLVACLSCGEVPSWGDILWCFDDE